MCLRFFDSISLKYCTCHEKVKPGHAKCCTCHAKSSWQTWRSDAPNATTLRKSAPRLPNISDEHVSCIAIDTQHTPLWRKAHLQVKMYKAHHSRTRFRSCDESGKNWRVRSTFGRSDVVLPGRRKGLCTLSKVRKKVRVLQHFQKRWQAWDIWRGFAMFCKFWSKRSPNVRCFAHFDLEMCFAPQRRALFRDRSFQKWSDHGVLWTFWLRNALRTTMTCNFSSFIFIWHMAPHPAALASLLFDRPEPQIIGKNTVNPDFSTFSRTCIFFLLSLSLLWSSLSLLLFSSLTVPTSAFHVSILSEVWLLNFLRLEGSSPYI